MNTCGMEEITSVVIPTIGQRALLCWKSFPRSALPQIKKTYVPILKTAPRSACLCALLQIMAKLSSPKNSSYEKMLEKGCNR